MPAKTFGVKAVWDEEAGVFHSESDIIGLHIEAETLEEFEAAVLECAGELIVANHIKPQELVEKPLAGLIPAIVFKPEPKHAAAAYG